jgi:CDP-diacylglycerol---serine O-phosphatidyltransferase
MVKQIPNALTLLNVFFGCCALVCIFKMQFEAAAWFILGSNIADFLDGAVARWLKVPSEMGKELDSLADMVSFGVVPGAILYQLLSKHYISYSVPNWAAMPAFIVTCFSCYRLAKFNLDTRQTEGFIGMATPSCTIFCTGLMLLSVSDTTNNWAWSEMLLRPQTLYVFIILLSYLLVSEIPMFSLKIKGFGWKGNEIRWTFLSIALGLLLLLREIAFAPIIIVYVLLNIGQFIFSRFAKIENT